MSRLLNKFGFFFVQLPIIKYIALFTASAWHPYVETGGFKILIKYNRVYKVSKKYAIDFKLSRTGVLLLFTSDTVFLMPLGDCSRNAIARSYNMYTLMQSSVIAQLFEYSFCVRYYEEDVFYEMERLQLPKQEDLTQVFAVKDLSRMPINSKVSYPFSRFSYQTHNLSTLSLYLSEFDIPSILGFVHGDLTPDNVLLNKLGKPVLIDLDKSEICGLCVYDDVHFTIESHVKYSRIGWLHALESKELSEQYIAPVRAYYLLSRVYKECSVGARPSRGFYTRADQVAVRLISELRSI